MPGESIHSVGPPRFDRGERLRHRFYEPLLLLWILNRARTSTDVQPAVAEHSRRLPLPLRSFLDALSFICDYKHGGSTVNAIAAQSTAPGTKFWLASRDPNALTHLQLTLDRLERLRDKTNAEVAVIQNQVTAESIRFSKDKVTGYGRSLQFYLGKAKQNSGESASTIDPGLLAALDDLSSTVSNHAELTTRARLFDDRELTNLIRQASRVRCVSVWVPVRHVIRRLGSWSRKCHVLVAFARQYPHLIEDHTCGFLALPKPLHYPPADQKTNLESTLIRMLPANEKFRARQLYESLMNLRDFDIEKAFVKAFCNSEKRLEIHAEVYLMEHFYANNLRFVEKDKYIGCSKPSCYCCSLYMRYHPGNFVVRRSHGNAWPTWSPPLSHRLEQKEYFKLNLEVMNKVIAHLRRDVIEEIEDRTPWRQPPPDSTSDFPTRDSWEEDASIESEASGNEHL